jgi:hypothetical protein
MKRMNRRTFLAGAGSAVALGAAIPSALAAGASAAEGADNASQTEMYAMVEDPGIGIQTDASSSSDEGLSSLHNSSFVPDYLFKDSNLNGWRKLGQAGWRADGGEIVGTGNETGGWLVLDHPLQDPGFYTAFRCGSVCDLGVLLRLAKTAEGMTGTYLSFTNGDLHAENVTLDTNGDIISRKPLRDDGGQIRFATPDADPTALPLPERVTPYEGTSDASLPPGAMRPHSGFRQGDWNEIEILLDANLMRARLNDTGPQVSVATAGDDMDSYGPIALYVGKGAEARFKNTSYKDLAIRYQPLEQVGSGFRVQRVTPFYYNWTAVAADFNHDGTLDLISGPYLYFGPDFTHFREIYPARTFNPSTEYSTWDQHAYDFSGEGWPDVVATYLNIGAVLYVNPRGESRRWKQYRVLPTMQSEYSILKDIDGDGKPELVYKADGCVRYAKPDPKDRTRPWLVHTISERGPWSAHGIGVGDINGDGRLDIVGADGWWEQPPQGSGDQLWKYHPVSFGRWGPVTHGGSEIGVYDINGDGLNDVITSLDAHGFGLAWYEQKRTSSGEISFAEHMIMDDYHTKNAGGVTFSEIHGTAVADVNGDGIPDFIAGKRQFSHKDDLLDPDAYSPPLLYWFETVRDPKAPGGARFVPHLIHNDSGAGDNLLAVDLNGNGAIDIVAATKRGLYIYWNQTKGKQRA